MVHRTSSGGASGVDSRVEAVVEAEEGPSPTRLKALIITYKKNNLFNFNSNILPGLKNDSPRIL